MKLAYWMYAGPAHIGTLRIASSFKNVHAIMHAPLGDDYFNVMRSMLERQKNITKVTTSIIDKNVLTQGSGNKIIRNILKKDTEDNPKLILVTPTCTSSILQEDLDTFIKTSSLETNADVLLADVNHYRVNEYQAADITLKQIIQFYLKKYINSIIFTTKEPSVNIIGAYSLAFHNQHDILELIKLLTELNIKINLILPKGASIEDLKNLPQAWVNIVPYRETGLLAAEWLKKTFNMPYISTTPLGHENLAKWIKELEYCLKSKGIYNINFNNFIEYNTKFNSQSFWFSRSIDCQNLIGKSAVVFGDSTHVAATTKILKKELGINVLWAGTYCKSDQKWFHKTLKKYTNNIFISENYSVIERLIKNASPDAIFGTQMERHIGKKLGIPCGVISAPVHIQNYPIGYRPFFGYEGANQFIDMIYNTFSLGLETILLEVFGGHERQLTEKGSNLIQEKCTWTKEAEDIFAQIPKIFQKKIKQNIEKYAISINVSRITPEILYEAKASLTKGKVKL